MSGQHRMIRSAPERERSLRRTIAAAMSVLLGTLGIALLGSTQATAAAGDPFPVGPGLVFVAQGDPTRLFKAEQTPTGAVAFTPEGPVSGGRYNAIAFRESDRYLYAMRQNTDGSRNLLRIGQLGQVTGLGPVIGIPVLDYNQGTFGDDGLFYVRDAQNSTRLFAVNVDTVTGTSIPLSVAVPNVSDLVWKDGFLWSVYGEGQRIYRINPTTGAVSFWPIPAGFNMPPDPYGAQWLYGNDNLGASNNRTGTVFQIQVTNPGAATPTFTLVSRISGPASTNNDGASSPGAPADLSLEKSAPATFLPGGAVAYSITITNNGPGASSGWVLSDTIPAGLLSPATSSPGCSITAGVLNCAGGPLAVGQAITLTFSGTTAAGQVACITNSASVLGNEPDAVIGNNTDDATTCPGGLEQSFAVQKTSSPAVARSGDTVTYTITVINTGNAPFTAGDPASFTDDLSGILDDATYVAGSATNGAVVDVPGAELSWSGALAVGAQVQISYQVTVGASPTDYSLVNLVVPGDDGECIVAEQCTTTTPIAAFHVTKTALTPAPVLSGDPVEYQLLVENVGTYAYTADDPASLTDDMSAFLDDGTPDPGSIVASAGTASYIQPLLSWSGPLAVSGSVTITYTVLTNDPISGDGSLVNIVTTPRDGNCVAGSGDPDCTTDTPLEERPFDLQVVKSTPAEFEAGGIVVYTITVTNLGPGASTAWSLADVVPAELTNPQTTSPGCTIAAGSLSCVHLTPMLEGDAVVITFTGESAPDQTACISNTATLTPGAGEIVPGNNTSTAETCPGVAVGSYTVQKRIAEFDLLRTARPGQTITYVVTVTNTGAVAYTAANPATFTDDLTAVLDDATLGPLPAGATFAAPTLSWEGAVPVGGFVEVRYAVTIPDPLIPTGDKVLTNAVVPGGEGTCVSAAACTTETPVASFQVEKAATPTETIAGGVVEYTITVTNTGTENYTAASPASFTDDLSDVLTNATMNTASVSGGAQFTAPLLTWSGALVVGTPVVITYSVTVNDPVGGDGVLDNTVVTPPGSGGNCPAGVADPLCTASVPVLSYEVSKTAEVDQTDPAVIVVRYTVTVTNTGQGDYTVANPAVFQDDLTGVLDDATYNGDGSTGVTIGATFLGWSGPLAQGATELVTYSFTVNDPVEGDRHLINVVLPDPDKGGECTSTPECTTDTPVRQYRAEKTVSPTTPVNPGDRITYTITITNTGATAFTDELPAMLDDDLTEALVNATFDDDIIGPSNTTFTDPILSWSGGLGVGESLSISYTMTALSVTASTVVTNSIVTGADGNCTIEPPPDVIVVFAMGPECTALAQIDPAAVPPPPDPDGLAVTGTTIGGLAALAAGLLAAGLAVALSHRPRGQRRH